MLQESATGGLDREVLPSQGSSSVIAPGIRRNCSELSARSVLRSATDDIHERMHRHSGFALLATGTIERAAYRRLLARSYGFYAMAERMLGRGDDWVGRLAHDLADLGLSHQAIARLPQCPPPTFGKGAADRIGATYVLLGASLGGRVMARAVAHRASASEPLPTRFPRRGRRCRLERLRDAARPVAP